MTRQELDEISNKFEPFSDPNLKLNTFHEKESGMVIMIAFNPNILGITKLSDFLTLKSDNLRNLAFWFKTRDSKRLEEMLGVWRKRKDTSIHDIATKIHEEINKTLIIN